MLLSTFTFLCNHHHRPPPELLIFPNWNPIIFKQELLIPSSPLPQALATAILRSFSFSFLTYRFWGRGGETGTGTGTETSTWCWTYWGIPSLTLVCALIGNQICNLGLSGWCSNQLTRPARAHNSTFHLCESSYMWLTALVTSCKWSDTVIALLWLAHFLQHSVFKLHPCFACVRISALKKIVMSPGWCGSVDWVLTCKPKGCQFGSQSGHMPGLWAGSPVGGALEESTRWCFSCSFPLSLKINK